MTKRFLPLSAGSLVVTIIAAAMAAACSNAGPGEPNLFPLNAGWKWTYEMTTTAAGTTRVEPYTVENLGFKNYGDGLEGFERRNSLGNFYLFRSDGAGIYRYGVRNEIEDTMRPDAVSPRRFVMKMPLAKGTSWQVPSVPYLMKRSFDWPFELRLTHKIMLNYEIEGLDETITVKAGEFKNCMLIIARNQLKVYIDPANGFQDVPILQKEWYCKDVGLVKLTRDEPVVKSPYFTGGSMNFELVQWSKK